MRSSEKGERMTAEGGKMPMPPYQATQSPTQRASSEVFKFTQTSVAMATESSGYVWLRAPNGFMHILLVIRLEYKFRYFSFIAASKS